MIDRLRQRITAGERGAALVWVAGSMVALLAMTALAVDLGWYYLNSARLQRAADSAALAGVMHLPSSPANATTDAESAARVNDFASATVTGAVLSDNRYAVTLDVDVPMFFASVVGINSLPLERTATAEYVKPVPMGSPFNSFGYGYDSAQNFWAAIQAPYTAKEHGDPYATRCITASGSGTCSGNNPDYRSTGYYYGIDVPSGKSYLDVEAYDFPFYDRGSASTQTGDLDGLTGTASGGPIMHAQLYAPDSTPLDPSDNVSLGSGCSWSINPESSSGTYKNQWRRLCRVNNPTPGIYILRVWTTGNGGGSNHYGLRSLTSGSQNSRVYGINDMSVFTNDVTGTGTARVYLAEISPVHAGKKLELRFFDPGEGSGNAYMTVKNPAGTIPNCSWSATNEAGSQTASGSGQCRIQTTVSGSARFNGQWVTATINIPASYTCTTNCWWTMDLQLNTPHDRTTWEARVIGNPVRLIPNP